MPTNKMARYAEIKAEHSRRLERYGISLVCYECVEADKDERKAMNAHGKEWPPSYTPDPAVTVVFYPNQDEAFSVMVRRAGPEASQRLRKVLEHPARCRLLCPAHLDRAKDGWTKRREELRRLNANVGYDGPPHDLLLPDGFILNGKVIISPGTVVRVDEFGCGPWLGAATYEKFKQYKAEWLAEEGMPPPYDGGGWVRLSESRWVKLP